MTTANSRETTIISQDIFDRALSDAIDSAAVLDIYPNDIQAVAIRVVAPGSFFTKNRMVDEEFFDRIELAKQMAPLHIAATQAEIKRIQDYLPGVKMYGISDSAEHAHMPLPAKHYAIGRKDALQHDVLRFGYHGISVASAMRTLSFISGMHHERVIVCHLGGGSSVTALKGGESIDTSMGFSPLEGVPMATRSGSIDISAALYLAQKKQFDNQALLEYLNHQSGLLGLSGSSDDIRTLLEKSDSGDSSATDALEHFAYRIRQFIGAYMATMGGLDILVFTGTVGYRSPYIRSLICRELEGLGLSIDELKNQNLSGNAFINEDGHVGIAVIQTDEQTEMAEQCLRILEKN